VGDIFYHISQFFQSFKFWVTISPWEQALRVRLGKNVVLLGPGIHLFFPVTDVLYRQSVRMRICILNRQTLTSRDGKTIVLAGSLGYCLKDINKLYRTLHHADDTLASMARVAIAEYVATNAFAACTPQQIVDHINKTVDLAQYGLGNVSVYITEFSSCRTFRLIGDHTADSISYDDLRTDNACVKP
jgi:hypothetical protein